MHRLVERQLRKAFAGRTLLRDGELSADVEPSLAAFVRMVDAAYAAEDEDRAQFDRSLHLASEELFERNRQLETELGERKRLEVELRVGEKLRAVGQLAGGIAHEINTPIQYVGDSLLFLQEAFGELFQLLLAYEAERTHDAGLRGSPDAGQALQAMADSIDLPYLKDAVPRAVERCREGIDRIAIIVRALKNMAHPDAAEQQPADLNAAIENTLVVCASQIKTVAETELALRASNSVVCHPGEIQQVLLHLVVNAAHAIEDKQAASGTRGLIRIETFERGAEFCINISDNGSGIPLEIRDRLFEPFFTTKEVGKGTGQGLCIARLLVVERHGGKLSFDSTEGVGTTFKIRLPIAGRSQPSLVPAGRVAP